MLLMIHIHLSETRPSLQIGGSASFCLAADLSQLHRLRQRMPGVSKQGLRPLPVLFAQRPTTAELLMPLHRYLM